MKRIFVLLFLCQMSLSACGSMPTGAPRFSTGDAKPIRVAHSTTAVQRLIGSEFRRWEGTPHRMGGTGRNGFDCSGFAQHLFEHLFAVQLPRSTRQQVDSGLTINRSALRPGDLVFFRPPEYARHVGIYVGNGQFVHVSSSRGVVKSRLDNPYWRRYFWMARRVIVPADVEV